MCTCRHRRPCCRTAPPSPERSEQARREFSVLPEDKHHHAAIREVVDEASWIDTQSVGLLAGSRVFSRPGDHLPTAPEHQSFISGIGAIPRKAVTADPDSCDARPGCHQRRTCAGICCACLRRAVLQVCHLGNDAVLPVNFWNGLDVVDPVERRVRPSLHPRHEQITLACRPRTDEVDRGPSPRGPIVLGRPTFRAERLRERSSRCLRS